MKPEPEELETNAVERYEPPETPTVHATNPLDLPVEQFKEGLDRRKTNRQALMDWIRTSLVEDTDYGKIHVAKKSVCDLGKYCKNPRHFSKPVLFKPGAEKICGMLGVHAKFPTIKDYEQAAVSGVAIDTIILRCEIVDSLGNVLAEGVGARSVVKEYGDTNKALKMAEKSAHIDSTLRLAGLSEIFTQDLETMAQDGTLEPEEPPQGSSMYPAVSEGVAEVLRIAKENREHAGEGISDKTCGKCGAMVKTSTAKAGHQFEQCTAARQNQETYAEGGHHYRKLSK